ncbi:bifunctional diaminohydroxyphosphoribosylaminopyrimidine deaminase/5-amino-6-(5-phosphoribosylamino)uracil reductase RibD [Pyrinomonas methylaliphatogenes]|uniref:Riboflavin biosynthesis protein RibD n=1 Tax=Pyrinomonas methylaliphatogenes TaxID=454194 RepID=A0A0B6WZP1_9BACT|nr:bifunctional diaminohydroxyphosphoribosylaminopyrimidine deaminase/5-amino-6-(5-phosphoribosylamino)uracil reductase RibD [Pyrinomonas methylaliphatogenes]CDM66182.1 diaminohydroxyphosphoribosylaminopyrimidine deaminase [Pyrinomonas methylaliphatogenes]
MIGARGELSAIFNPSGLVEADLKSGTRDCELKIDEAGQSVAARLDLHYMGRALELAARGRGQASPNPLVGCVIVDESGRVIGEGFHVYAQVKHAETIALEQAGARAHGATCYVSLEPCAHYGRTPPCTDALIRAGIRRLVAPIEDPNPLVAGRGFAQLRAAGVEVSVGLMAREAERLNEHYLHFMRTGRPFVHLKLACSLDGRIATAKGDAHWITGERARMRVHELRHECDAILIGAGTAIADDPLLTDRSGLPRHRPLVRVVLDGRLRLRKDSRLAQTARELPTLVFTSEEADQERAAELEACGIEVVRSGGGLSAVLGELARRKVQSVLVEGGSNIASRFIKDRLVDRITFFIAPLIIGADGIVAIGELGIEKLTEAIRLREVEVERHGDDVEITGYPIWTD